MENVIIVSTTDRLYFYGKYIDVRIEKNIKDEYDGEYKMLDNKDKDVLRHCLFKQDRRYGIDVLKFTIGMNNVFGDPITVIW
jgi:hypothetical protein